MGLNARKTIGGDTKGGPIGAKREGENFRWRQTVGLGRSEGRSLRRRREHGGWARRVSMSGGKRQRQMVYGKQTEVVKAGTDEGARKGNDL